jgi:hypothetical protein
MLRLGYDAGPPLVLDFSNFMWFTPMRHPASDSAICSFGKSRPFITSPLAWQMTADPVAPPMIPVIAECGGNTTEDTTSDSMVDTREQVPLDFSRFEGWFAGIERKALKLGDYSIVGREDKPRRKGGVSLVIDFLGSAKLTDHLQTERQLSKSVFAVSKHCLCHWVSW